MKEGAKGRGVTSKQMVVTMKVILKTMLQMAMATILIDLDTSMKASGRIICQMALER